VLTPLTVSMSLLRSSRLSRLLPFGSGGRSPAPEPRSSPPSDAPAVPVEASAGSIAVDDPCPQGLEIVAEGVSPLVESVPLRLSSAALLLPSPG
jgi:hypothetical protein